MGLSGERAPIIVMGVSSAGKSTVGRALAERLGASFIDADELHPVENVEMMASGVPLTDADRWPWLDHVVEAIRGSDADRVVLACSALKRSYRDRIRHAAPGAVFVHIRGNPDLIGTRMAMRRDHFMSADLLDSQFDTIEPLEDDERGLTVDAAQPVHQQVATIIGSDLVDES